MWYAKVPGAAGRGAGGVVTSPGEARGGGPGGLDWGGGKGLGGGVLCHFAVGLRGVFRIGWVFGWQCVFGNSLGGWAGDLVWGLYDLIMPMAEARGGGWRRFGECSWLCDCGARKKRRDRLFAWSFFVWLMRDTFAVPFTGSRSEGAVGWRYGDFMRIGELAPRAGFRRRERERVWWRHVADLRSLMMRGAMGIRSAHTGVESRSNYRHPPPSLPIPL